MNTIKLSICIPTYNRSTYLDQTIESIIDQVDANMVKDIEICISDNASTDGTEELIQDWRAKCLVKIVYSKNNENQGADRNYMRVIELSSGEYCWFFGSDDLIAEGGLRHMLQEIQTKKDIYLCNRIECDINMQSARERYWLDSCAPSQLFNLSKQSDLLRYLKSARSVGALFSYLSSIVFKRQRWLQCKLDPEFIGTAYSHVYMLLSFIPNGCELVYIRDQLVICRGQNDGFMSEGAVKRVMLDIDGYTLLARRCLEDQQVRSGLLNVLQLDRPVWLTLAFVRKNTNSQEWKNLSNSFRQAGYGNIKIAVIGKLRSFSKILYLFFFVVQKLKVEIKKRGNWIIQEILLRGSYK